MQTRHELSRLLFRLLNDEEILLRWPQKIACSAFTLGNAKLVAGLASALVDQDSAQAYAGWATSCQDKPQVIFLPIAKVILHQVLHQRCWPLPLLCIVVSIKALVDGSANADDLPSELPMETLLSATKWLGPTESAEWNRNVAVALRNSDHYEQAVVYFERALWIEPNNMAARDGLAKVYRYMRDYETTISFGEETIVLLGRAEDNGIADRYTHAQIHEELGCAYSNLAGTHRMLEDSEKILHAYEQAAYSGKIEFDWHAYVRELIKIPEEVAFPKMLSFLAFLQTKKDDDAGNCLTVYLPGYVGISTRILPSPSGCGLRIMLES